MTFTRANANPKVSPAGCQAGCDLKKPTPLPRRRTRGARGGGPVCERRAAAAGWQVPAKPNMPRLNSELRLVRWSCPQTAAVLTTLITRYRWTAYVHMKLVLYFKVTVVCDVHPRERRGCVRLPCKAPQPLIPCSR